ncbi:MAG TPA: hypothetical protein VHA37_01795 [Candidatus Saccharimonadales bacterium]|nr:hypothetical protein [Candidatus Saccharimonadales bacterium]
MIDIEKEWHVFATERCNGHAVAERRDRFLFDGDEIVGRIIAGVGYELQRADCDVWVHVSLHATLEAAWNEFQLRYPEYW